MPPQILEIQPKSTSEVPPGTRLCAFWSQQYRCLYPGIATTPSSPDSDIDDKYVNVEFDDGDNGRIVLDHIRFLLSDYPIVGEFERASEALTALDIPIHFSQNTTRTLFSRSTSGNDR